MATPPIPTVLPKSKPTVGVQRGRAAADFYSDLQSTMANLGPLSSGFDDPEAFLGFGDSRTPDLPSLARVETPEVAADRRKQSGDFARGMGLGLTTDIVGLAGDLPALLLSDAPRFAAALATGKSIDEMPKTLIDEGLNAIRNTIGSDALAGYLGVSEENLNNPAMTSGRLLSSIVDPAVVYGVIRGAMGISRAQKATDAAEEGIAGLLPAPAQQDGDGIAAAIPEEAAIADAAPTTLEDVIGNANFDPDPDVIDMQRSVYGNQTNEQLLQDFERRSSDLRQGQANLAAAQGNPDAPFFEAENAQTLIDLAEMDLNQIRNELVGRRDGHLVQLTDAEAQALMPQMPEELADQIEAVRTGPMEPEVVDDVVSLDVTDTQGNVIPEAGFGGQPGGIGALDEAAPIYGNYTVKIGASPDQYLGTVEHYSPTMTNYYNFVGNRAFARQADNTGKMSAKQWLAALNKNPNSSQKIGPVAKELKDSEFERILLENPDKKYSQEEIRRLVTSRLPQTRERVFLESTMANDTQNGTNPFSSDTIPYLDYQYRTEDLESAVDKGLIVFSNTAPTIEIPGLGRVKPRAVHDYYGKYPGYYGHTRFLVVENVDGKKYLQINEIQSNSIANISSGFKVGWTTNALGETVPEYAKTLEQRLNAWRGGNEDMRVPYTPEIHAKLQKLQDLKPEVLRTEERLLNEAQEIEFKVTEEESSFNYRSLPENKLSPDAEMGTLISLGRATRSIAEDPAAVVGLLSDLENYQPIMGGEATDRVSDLIVNKLDETGEVYSAIQAGNLADFYKDIFNDIQRYRRNGQYYLWNDQSRREVTGTNADFIQQSETDPILDAMTDEQLFGTLVKDRLRKTAASAVDDSLQAMISRNETFIEAFENLPLEDLETMAITSLDDTVNTPAVKERKAEIATAVFDKFSDADIESIQESFTSYVNNDLANIGFTSDVTIDQTTDAFKDLAKRNVEYLLLLEQKGLLAKARINKLNENAQAIEAQRAAIAADLPSATQSYSNAIAAQPDEEEMLTLFEIAKKTKSTNGKKGFQAPEPYNSDADFYQFATRSAIKQAEKLGLDGVIFPDAMYLATQPQRSPNDAFLRNYGRVIDKELAELSKADSNAGMTIRRTDTPVTNNENPGMRISGRTNNNFVVEGVDPADETAQATLQPLRDEVRRRRQAVDQAAQAGVPDLFDVRSEYREAKRVLDAEVNRLSREYAAPLRVVEFDNPANRDLAQRPIRRAAGGMVNSGIGAMAREVM